MSNDNPEISRQGLLTAKKCVDFSIGIYSYILTMKLSEWAIHKRNIIHDRLADVENRKATGSSRMA
jgi:hypothetical protein